MMNTEYTTSTGYKIFYSALGIVAIGFALFLFKISAHPPSKFIFLLPLFILAFGVMIIINLFKRKLTISDTGITYTNIFKSTTIPFDQVKGYRIGSKAIFIESNQTGFSKMWINDYVSIGDDESLKAWLSTNFKDLDAVEFEEEKEEILHDASFGATEADRERKLNNARKYAIGYSMAGPGLFFAAVILHRQIPALSYLLLIYPIAGVLLMGFSKGLIRLISKKNNAYASVFIGLLFPAGALIIQSMFDIKILNYDHIWVPVVGIGLAMFAAILFTGVKQSAQSLIGQVVVAILIAGAYGFGSTMQINSGFDQSSPQVYSASVVSHHISHGKSTTYHLILGEWGQHHEQDNISVSESFYDRVQVGDNLKVYLKKGALNIPWYYVNQ